MDDGLSKLGLKLPSGAAQEWLNVMDKLGNKDGRVDFLEFAQAVELLAGICKRGEGVIESSDDLGVSFFFFC